MGAFLAVATLGLPPAAADLDTVTLDWAYYDPVSLVLKQEGWLEEGCGRRDRGAVGAEPGLYKAAGVP